jgi:hypothetical protein
MSKKRFIYDVDILTPEEREVFDRVSSGRLDKMSNDDAAELFYMIDRIRKAHFAANRGE